MLRVIVNGKPVETAVGDLASLCAELGHGDARVATAVNGEFVPVRAREQHRLGPDDRIEIVSPRQGG